MKFRCEEVKTEIDSRARSIRVTVESPDIEDVAETIGDQVLDEMGPDAVVSHFGTEKLLAQMDKEEVLEYFNAIEKE